MQDRIDKEVKDARLVACCSLILSLVAIIFSSGLETLLRKDMHSEIEYIKKEYELDRAHDREQDKLDRALYNEINAQLRADIKGLQEKVKKLKAK